MSFSLWPSDMANSNVIRRMITMAPMQHAFNLASTKSRDANMSSRFKGSVSSLGSDSKNRTEKEAE